MGIDRVASESASKVVVDPTTGHGPQAVHGHLKGGSVSSGPCVGQAGHRVAGPWELRSRREASIDIVVALRKLSDEAIEADPQIEVIGREVDGKSIGQLCF